MITYKSTKLSTKFPIKTKRILDIRAMLFIIANVPMKDWKVDYIDKTNRCAEQGSKEHNIEIKILLIY